MNVCKNRRWGASKYALLASTALVTAFGAPAAMAQDVDTDTAETETAPDVVVVRGVRGALLNARNTRRNADTLVDSIVATDVSELPDLSVAEALSRVPGVVTQRFELGGSDGDFPSPEGSGNIIRGLQYVRSEFNGRDAFSANGGRALEWASIPPELIGAVEVFKNATASQIEGGISGAVNLRTLLPFDRDGLVAVFSADQTFTDLAEEWSPGYSAVLGNTWDMAGGGQFGLLGSFSTSELRSNIHGFQYGQLMAVPNPDAAGALMALPGGWQARDADVERARDSYYLASQWRSPGGNMEFSFTAIRVENEIETNERTIEFFTDAESWASWTVLGAPASRSIRPFVSGGLPRCNGAGEAANGGIGICESLIPVTGGLMESGLVSNNLRDWLGQTGNLQTPLQSLAIAQREESMTQDFAANLQWRVSDRLFVELDAHYTQAEASLQRLWTGGNHFADYGFDFSDIENPHINLFMSDQVRLADWGGTFRGQDPGVLGDLGDPRYAFLLYSADEFQDNSGDLFATRGDARYEFDGDGWFDSIDFGARYSRREQNNRSAGLNWASIAPPWAGGYLPYANLTDGEYDVHDFSGFQRGGVFNGFTSVVFPSQRQMQNYDAFVNMLAGQPLIGGGVNAAGNLQIGDWVPLRQNGTVDYVNRGSDGSVREETFNLYFQTNYSHDLANGQSLSGNFGLRYVNSETTGGGILAYAELAPDDPLDNTQPRDFLPETAAYLDRANEQNSISNSYSYVLPTFNLRWDVNDDWLIRFAASRAITPANIADLNSNQSQVAELGFVVDQNATPPVITNVVLGGINVFGGNPNLAPIESTNLDVAVEFYFGSDGLFTVSAFYKDLENIIVYGEDVQDTVTLDGYTVPVTFIGNTNRNNGNVEGIEIAYQQFFTEWPGLLGNLGVQANLTVLSSEAAAPPTARDQDGDGVEGFLTVYRWGVAELLGLSDYSYNLIGIYQSDNIEARLAYNWRSEYVSSYRDYITGNPIIQDDIGFLDASIRWNVTDNVTVRAQVANILDERSVAYQQVDAQGQRFGRSVFVNDRRFEFGVRYEF